MSEHNQPKKDSEEIDLGQLFRLIGNAFTRFFNFIGTIFKAIFHIFIQLLLFFRKHFFKFAIAVLVGIGIGWFLDTQRETLYAADLIVQPNFGSTQQLYKNVQYYNNLVKQHNTALLASTFKITPVEASSLKEFLIRPVKDENSSLDAYNKLLKQSSDSTLSIRYTYEDFKLNVSEYDYKTHGIQVTASKNDIFKKLESVIIESIKENSYFNAKRKTTLENLDRNDSILKGSIEEIDSLGSVYMDVLLAEAKRENPQGSTSIILSEKTKNTNELELFNTKIQFKNELNDNQTQRTENAEVINIISNFQPIGYEINVLYKKYYFIFGIAGFVAMFLFLAFRSFNTFLNSYQERKNKSQ